MQDTFKRATEIRAEFDNYTENYEIENMLMKQADIKEIEDIIAETEFMKTLDEGVLFENYAEVFKSEYQANTEHYSDQ